MSIFMKATDTVQWFLSELTSRVVAESGIPSDKYHLGKLILQSLKDAPDFVLQINAKTGVSETSGSVLERSVRCALSLKKMGLKSGDVMVVLGCNHLDMAVVFYAALYLGMKLAPVDTLFSVLEIKEMLQIDEPNIIICQDEHVPKVAEALNQINMKSHIVSFDEGTGLKTLADLIEESAADDVYSFEPPNIDPETSIAVLIFTGGSTGLPKVVPTTHKMLMISLSYIWTLYTEFPYPFKSTFLISPIQWVSATIQYFFSPVLRFTRIQTPDQITEEVFIEIVNTYKPEYIVSTPTLLTSMMKPGIKERIDFTCFKTIMTGGCTVQQLLIDELKEVNPNAIIYRGYGISESSSIAFDYKGQPRGSVGRPLSCLAYRLIDPNTLQDITEPFVNGELWVQGPTVFMGYYNNPEFNKEVFVDGWFRTGDIFYRDEHYWFYFVDRLKMLLKYKNNQVSPTELEKVILNHPGVLDVAVTGIPDKECGDLPVACVVLKPGNIVTAQEIKDLVKDTLTDSKQLRGGVMFVKNLPTTSTSKIDRKKLKEIVLTWSLSS